jgi:hypothetical protein
VLKNNSSNFFVKYKDINSVTSFIVTTFIGLSILFCLTGYLGKDRDYLIAFSFLFLNVIYIHKDEILKRISSNAWVEEINKIVLDTPRINHFFEYGFVKIAILTAILLNSYYRYYLYCVENIVFYNVLTAILAGFILFFLQKESFFALKQEKHSKSLTKELIYVVTLGLVIYVMCFSPLNQSAYEGLEHHWSYFIEPLNRIKEGGVLYWSIPYQYGFLNGVFLDIFSFYNPKATLLIFLFISYLAFFVTIFSVTYKLNTKHFLSTALGFLILTFFVPGWIFEGTSPLAYPSVTVFRFIGPIFSYMIFRHLLTTKLEGAKYLILSSIPVILSFLSLEVFMMILLMKFSLVSLTFKENKKKSWSLIAIDLVLYPVIISLIYIIYGIIHGVIIDPYSFIEYVLTYKENIRMTSAGNFMLFYFVLTYSFWLYRKTSNKLVYMNTMFMFSIGSYFILRSHDNNFLNIVPFVGFALLNNCIDTKGQFFSEFFYKKFIWVVSVIAVLANPTFTSKLLGFHAWQGKSIENASVKNYVENHQVPAYKISLNLPKEYTNNLSFVDLNANFMPKLLLNGVDIKANVLNLPFSHFNLLPDWRISIYLKRMVQSNLLTENLVLIRKKDIHAVGIPKALMEYYSVESTLSYVDKEVIFLKKQSLVSLAGRL